MLLLLRSSAETQERSGSASLTLAPLTVAAAGTVADAPGVTGSSGLMLDALSIAATGSVGVSGTSTLTLGPLALSSAGTVDVNGAAPLQLAPLTIAVHGYSYTPAAPPQIDDSAGRRRRMRGRR